MTPKKPRSGVQLPESIRGIATNPHSFQIPRESGERVDLLLSTPEFSPLWKEFLEFLNQNLIWQHEAKRVMASLMTKVESNTRRMTKGPLWKYIFVWPSGVGKNEIPRLLADFLLGSPEALTRIDCGKIKSSTNLTTLLGSNPQYVWAEIEPALSQEALFQHFEKALRHWDLHPGIALREIAILVLDEIDKAYSGFYDILYQIFDENEITLNKWEKLPTRNIIVIATTNLWQDEFQTFMETAVDRKRFLDDKQLQKHRRIQFERQAVGETLTPALLWRIDEVVHFDTLTHDDVMLILWQESEKLTELFKEEDILLDIDENVAEYFMRNYREITGVRPIVWKFHDMIHREVEKHKSNKAMSLYWNLPMGTHIRCSMSGKTMNSTVTVHRKISPYIEDNFQKTRDYIQELSGDGRYKMAEFLLLTACQSENMLPESYYELLDVSEIEEVDDVILHLCTGNPLRAKYLVDTCNLSEEIQGFLTTSDGKGYIADICREYLWKYPDVELEKYYTSIRVMLFDIDISEDLARIIQSQYVRRSTSRVPVVIADDSRK